MADKVIEHNWRGSHKTESVRTVACCKIWNNSFYAASNLRRREDVSGSAGRFSSLHSLPAALMHFIQKRNNNLRKKKKTLVLLCQKDSVYFCKSSIISLSNWVSKTWPVICRAAVSCASSPHNCHNFTNLSSLFLSLPSVSLRRALFCVPSISRFLMPEMLGSRPGTHETSSAGASGTTTVSVTPVKMSLSRVKQWPVFWQSWNAIMSDKAVKKKGEKKITLKQQLFYPEVVKSNTPIQIQCCGWARLSCAAWQIHYLSFPQRQITRIKVYLLSNWVEAGWRERNDQQVKCFPLRWTAFSPQCSNTRACNLSILFDFLSHILYSKDCKYREHRIGLSFCTLMRPLFLTSEIRSQSHPPPFFSSSSSFLLSTFSYSVWGVFVFVCAGGGQGHENKPLSLSLPGNVFIFLGPIF